jgi:putative flippase GtrA
LRILGRWARFNVVGWIGALVQVGLLTFLVRWWQVDYLLATALAVEAAVLHNFAWHEMWTWADSPSAGPAGLLGRLARFHLANGLISIAGNILLMTLLVGQAGLPVIAANLCAILICSSANFVLSHLWVFRHKPSR